MYISRVIERELHASLKNSKVLLLLGARQVGKTTLIERLFKNCTGSLLNMDIEIDRARLVAAAQLSPAEALKSLGASEAGDVLVIDEAQRVPDIGRITKGWYDAKVPTKIILLGSSSATLLDMAASELTGRNEKLWLTPLTFGEVLQQQPWYADSFSPTALHDKFGEPIESVLMSRLVFGSYPEAFLTDEPEQYLTNLSSDYLLKDIFTSSAVRQPEDVRRLLLELARELSNTVSVTQLATRLNLSRQTVERYLSLLEGIFVIFSVPAYATDPFKEITKQRKFYFWDTGVKNALQREWTVATQRSDIDALWENWVIAELLKASRTYRWHEDFFFWQSRNDSTVDLVIKRGDEIKALDMRFAGTGSRPSRSFTKAYDVAPIAITPQNVLEFLL